jgi:HEPN domain-containing protein
MNGPVFSRSKLLKREDSLVGNEIPAHYYSEEDASQCINYAESILKTVTKFMSN